VFRIRHAVPVLDPAVDRRNGVVVPARIVRLGREEVPIGLVTVRPQLRVDAGPATQDLAHGHRQGTPVEFGDWAQP
jgi:hypothetical protein